MNILHISKYYYPFRGGIEKVVEQLAEGAVEQGHQVTVLCSSESKQREEITHKGVKVIKVPRAFVLASQPFCFSFMRELNQIVNGFDLVHVHTPNPLFELGVLMCKIKVPMVVTYHCDVLNRNFLIKLYKPVAKKLLSCATSISCATPQHLEFSPVLKKFKDKVDVIPFGVRGNLSDRSLSRLAYIKRNRILHGDYFLFVGRLVAYKGLGFLIKAMTNVDAKLVIIGKGPKWKDWVQLTKNLNLQNKIIFLGGVESDDEFASYFHAAKGLVLPSLDASEAYGMVQIEAMSCKLPLVCTDLESGVRFVNVNNETGFVVPPKDSMSLASALNKLVVDQNLKNQMGERAYQRYLNFFQLNQMITKYFSLYNKTLGRPETVEVAVTEVSA